MNSTEIYSSLVAAAEEARPLSPPTMMTRFVSMLDDAEIRLRTKAAWRLDPKVASKLKERSDVQPPGGWTAFVSLLAGTPWLAASREEFEVEEVPEEDEPLRRQLVEAYTKRLVPPTTASSTFVLLGVHPAWGVRLAHRMHPGSDSSTKHRDLLPEETLQFVDDAVFRFIGTVVEGLAEMEADQTVPMTQFEQFLRAAVKHAGDQAREAAPDNFQGLSPFVGRKQNDLDGIGALLTKEWVEEVLVPAGAGELRGQSFVVDGDLLAEVNVGATDRDYEGLSSFLEATPAEASA